MTMGGEKKGFPLAEVMIVVAIIVLLFAIAMPHIKWFRPERSVEGDSLTEELATETETNVVKEEGQATEED